jgi:predicted PurR-regulated permease PerM
MSSFSMLLYLFFVPADLAMPDESNAVNSDPPVGHVEHMRVDTKAVDRSHAVSPAPASKIDRRHVERGCLIFLTTLAVFYTLYFARAILLPTTLAVILSLVLKPVTKRLDRLGLPSMVSAFLVLGAFSLVIGAGITALWQPASQWVAQAPTSLSKVGDQLRSVVRPLEDIKKAKSEVDKMTSVPGDAAAEASPIPVEVKQPPLTSELLNTTGGFATAAIITLSLLFFLLASGDRFLEKAVQIRHTWREKREVVLLVKEIEQKMSAYLGAITVINIGLGIVIGTGLWAIDMPNPVLWGVLATLLNYIPFAGLVIGTCIVSIVAIAEFGSIGHAMLAPAVYLGANGVEANLITPAMLGRSISLNPVVILLAVFLGGWIWGVGGIFLAVPILLVVKIACEGNESLDPISVLLAR